MERLFFPTEISPFFSAKTESRVLTLDKGGKREGNREHRQCPPAWNAEAFLCN